jgi:hypothetical protein
MSGKPTAQDNVTHRVMLETHGLRGMRYARGAGRQSWLNAGGLAEGRARRQQHTDAGPMPRRLLGDDALVRADFALRFVAVPL